MTGNHWSETNNRPHSSHQPCSAGVAIRHPHFDLRPIIEGSIETGVSSAIDAIKLLDSDLVGQKPRSNLGRARLHRCCPEEPAYDPSKKERCQECDSHRKWRERVNSKVGEQ